MKPPVEAQCPRCGSVAIGVQQVEESFGFRKLRGKRITQSWCRKCRGMGSLAFADDRPAMGDRWATPRDLFRELNARWHYTVDGAAEMRNALCERYFSDGLRVSWEGERVWCNPPYSHIDPWVGKAMEADVATLLLPVRTDRPWFDLMWDRAAGTPVKGWRVDFIRGRVRFAGAGQDPNWPTMACTFGGI